MTERRSLERLQRDTRGAVYVEFLVAIMPVLIFFFGLLQLALIYTAQLVVQHAAARAARAAVVVLDDDPQNYQDEDRGAVTYQRPPGAGAGGQNLTQFSSVLGIELPMAELQDMANSEAGPRLSTIRQAAYMPLAVLAPTPESLFRHFGLNSASVEHLGNGARFLMGLLLYNRAAAMITLRLPDGSLANDIGATDDVTVRVTYLLNCSIPIVSNFMCTSLSALAGFDQVGESVGRFQEDLRADGLLGAQDAARNLRQSLQSASDTLASLSQELKYADAPELLVPFLFTNAHFKLIRAEATLPNQGACYYPGSSCFAGAPVTPAEPAPENGEPAP